MRFDLEKYHRTRQVSPFRIVLILLVVNLFLGLLVLAFPTGERWFGEHFKLQFVSGSDLFHANEERYVDLDTVLSGLNLEGDTSSFDQEIIAEADSLITEPELEKRIQYNGDSTALNTFFKALWALESGEPELFRILHYGDSQLEGDRISDYLRNKLQLRFGGKGPGIVLPIDVSRSRLSVLQSESRDWKKYAIYGKTRHPKGWYGIGGSSYEYTGAVPVKVAEDTIIKKVFDSLVPLKSTVKTLKKDTFLSDSAMVEVKMVPFDSSAFHFDTVYKPIYEKRLVESSWLRYRCARGSYPLVRTFNRVELMYSAVDSCLLTVKVDSLVKRFKIGPTNGVRKLVLHTGMVGEEVKLNFTGFSPTIYGVFLDGQQGIAVDNFPMRGSSGTGFSSIRRDYYTSQLKQAGVKLIVMQYGINVVPNPVKNYDFYERMFLAELKAIRAAYPDVSILVIGPSDMSRKRGGVYESYPNVTKIRDAMRNAAFASDCAFWDLYAAMGGENSMISWVENSPSLASKDYTHFNIRGARFVGEMFYDALLSSYIDWKKRTLVPASDQKVGVPLKSKNAS